MRELVTKSTTLATAPLVYTSPNVQPTKHPRQLDRRACRERERGTCWVDNWIERLHFLLGQLAEPVFASGRKGAPNNKTRSVLLRMQCIWRLLNRPIGRTSVCTKEEKCTWQQDQIRPHKNTIHLETSRPIGRTSVWMEEQKCTWRRDQIRTHPSLSLPNTRIPLFPHSCVFTSQECNACQYSLFRRQEKTYGLWESVPTRVAI